jgi:hypothetical protein
MVVPQMVPSERPARLEKLASGRGYVTRVRFGKQRRRVRIMFADAALTFSRSEKGWRGVSVRDPLALNPGRSLGAASTRS